MAGSAAVVQWLGRDDGNFLGRVQWTADCGAPPSGTQGHRDPLLNRRPLRRRCALHGRRPSYCRTGVGLVLFRVTVPSARSNACRRRLASDVAGAVAEDTLLFRALAAAPTTRRLLEARVGMPGLRSDPMPSIRGRWLDRRLQECNSTAPRAAEGATQGSHRAVGTCLSAFCPSGPADRVSSGNAALVGPLVEGH